MQSHFMFLFLLFCWVSLSSANSFQDTRDQKTYQTASYGDLNWFQENVRYYNRSLHALNYKVLFYSDRELSAVCPAPYSVPSVEDWKNLEHNLLKQKVKKVWKSFAGSAMGYYVPKKEKKQVENKQDVYFWAKNASGHQLVRFNPKAGKINFESPKPRSYVAVRCVRKRNYLEEKGIVDGILTDKRNGRQYPVITIENAIWMNSNLAYELSSPYLKKDTLLPKNCYLEDPIFCERFGRYYTWQEARQACPSGWRLPSDNDWRHFIKQGAVDWENMGCGGCKDWNSYGDGLNAGHYWSSSKAQKNKPRAFEIRKSSKAIDRSDEDPQKGLYVRCVTDLK